ncbi:hypothetical protein ACFLVY_02315 [Chloroflexota bacterium]
MNKVILQPAGGIAAQDHFDKTIRKPVALDRIRPHITADQYKSLADIYADGIVPTWGVVPGADRGNIKQWQKISYGDVVLFSGQKRFFASGGGYLQTS